MERPELLNTEEAAAYMGVSTRTVKMYAANGRIRAQKIAHAWHFTEDALRQFMTGEKQQDITGLAAFVPGLSADLRRLRLRLAQGGTRDALINTLDDILRDYVAPMELLISKSQ